MCVQFEVRNKQVPLCQCRAHLQHCSVLETCQGDLQLHEQVNVRRKMEQCTRILFIHNNDQVHITHESILNESIKSVR